MAIKLSSRSVAPEVEVPATPDPSEAINAALESLTRQTQLAMQMIARVSEGQKQTHDDLLSMAAARTPPIRLEADIERDSDGKMTRVVITPIR